ncbi:MAG: ATP-dependent DNA ligase [Euryarchaeota archaeon]|nr:ATP-dependent DNA ligase [Euryarchaeota archaeon]
MLYSSLVEVFQQFESTTSRIRLTDIVSKLFKGSPINLLPVIIYMLIGKVFPSWDSRKLDVSGSTIFAALKQATGADNPTIIKAFKETGDIGSTAELIYKTKKPIALFSKQLTISDVYNGFVDIARVTGPGSRKKKERILLGLLNSASSSEVKYILRNVIGDMRHGVNEGIVEEAIAKAFQIPVDLVQRSYMIANDLGLVAQVAKNSGITGLKQLKLTIMRPIKPMLAQSVSDIKEALSEIKKPAFEWKLDGARAQIHKQKDKIKIFSRGTEDITQAFPEIVKSLKEGIVANEAILEGEIVAIDPLNSKPRPFQFVLRRFRRKYSVSELEKIIPVKLYLFDLLYLNRNSFLNKPFTERRNTLEKIIVQNPKIELTKLVITNEISVAQTMFNEAIEIGHEGLMIKDPNASYIPGIRGKKMLKVKAALETLDLAVIEADYGYGRKHKWLSSYALVAMDETSGKLVAVGRVFTGLSDEELEEITKKLKEIAIQEIGRSVIVRPEIVLEVGFGEIQKSPVYDSGFALRFPRIIAIREDLSLEDIDSLQKIKELYKRQTKAQSGAINQIKTP